MTHLLALALGCALGLALRGAINRSDLEDARMRGITDTLDELTRGQPAEVCIPAARAADAARRRTW